MTDLLTDTELAEIERLTKLHIGDRPPWGNTILRLVGEVMRLRAAEQPPTPPAGIERVPGRVGGRAVLVGTRFPVARVLAEIADGHSVEWIADNYDLDATAIRNALSDLARELDAEKPTPPSGRGEERERIEEIRRDLHASMEQDKAADWRACGYLLAAIDSRDAVIAGLVTVMERANAGELEYGEYEAALEAARPFTKETR